MLRNSAHVLIILFEYLRHLLYEQLIVILDGAGYRGALQLGNKPGTDKPLVNAPSWHPFTIHHVESRWIIFVVHQNKRFYDL